MKQAEILALRKLVERQNPSDAALLSKALDELEEWGVEDPPDNIDHEWETMSQEEKQAWFASR